jgi:hypothetical protein
LEHEYKSFKENSGHEIKELKLKCGEFNINKENKDCRMKEHELKFEVVSQKHNSYNEGNENETNELKLKYNENTNTGEIKDKEITRLKLKYDKLKNKYKN